MVAIKCNFWNTETRTYHQLEQGLGKPLFSVFFDEHVRCPWFLGLWTCYTNALFFVLTLDKMWVTWGKSQYLLFHSPSPYVIPNDTLLNRTRFSANTPWTNKLMLNSLNNNSYHWCSTPHSTCFPTRIQRKVCILIWGDTMLMNEVPRVEQPGWKLDSVTLIWGCGGNSPQILIPQFPCLQKKKKR